MCSGLANNSNNYYISDAAISSLIGEYTLVTCPMGRRSRWTIQWGRLWVR